MRNALISAGLLTTILTACTGDATVRQTPSSVFGPGFDLMTIEERRNELSPIPNVAQAGDAKGTWELLAEEPTIGVSPGFDLRTPQERRDELPPGLRGPFVDREQLQALAAAQRQQRLSAVTEEPVTFDLRTPQERREEGVPLNFID